MDPEGEGRGRGGEGRGGEGRGREGRGGEGRGGERGQCHTDGDNCMSIDYN